ncbi:MAG: hypothetical protein AAF483_12980 [Planctomycetota bacterium]
MRRVSHDVPGVAQRLNKLTNELEQSAQDTAEVWKDEKGRAFLQKHISEVRPIVVHLTSSLMNTIELYEEIAKRLRDPDQY